MADEPFDAKAYLEQQARADAAGAGTTEHAQPTDPVAPQHPSDAAPRIASQDRTPVETTATVDDAAARDYGAKLAIALREGGYHPVILFGTSASGKTSLLVSLFATLLKEPRLHVTLKRREPSLGLAPGIEGELRNEARTIFENKTQLFIEGNLPPATPMGPPFFIPVEVMPEGKPAARIAFLESAGEAYRPIRAALTSDDNRARLYPQLRKDIECFIADFQGPITFLYLAPFTQRAATSVETSPADVQALADAELAIKNVLETYDEIRIDYRAGDWHHLLLTKWDAHSARTADADERASDDREAQMEFLDHRYPQALVALRNLQVPRDRIKVNAYCAGIVNQRGLLQTALHSDLKGVVQRYPEGMWTRLYCNALSAQDLAPVSPFPEEPTRHPLLRAVDRVLRVITGH